MHAQVAGSDNSPAPAAPPARDAATGAMDTGPTDGFAALLARSVAAQRAAALDDRTTIPGRLADLSRRFVTLDRQLPAAMRRLAELEALGEPAAFAAAELARLRDVAGVERVEVADDGDILVIVTAPVAVAWGGAAYALGTFRLLFDLAGDVRVESVERPGPRPAWDHPHVQDGLPCLGNLRAGLLKLIAEYELALAAQVLIDFLHTYQPEDAYTPIEGWPRADAAPAQPQETIPENAGR